MWKVAEPNSIVVVRSTISNWRKVDSHPRHKSNWWSANYPKTCQIFKSNINFQGAFFCGFTLSFFVDKIGVFYSKWKLLYCFSPEIICTKVQKQWIVTSRVVDQKIPNYTLHLCKRRLTYIIDTDTAYAVQKTKRHLQKNKWYFFFSKVSVFLQHQLWVLHAVRSIFFFI